MHEGPRDEELDRARNRLEAGWRWEQEDLAGLAAGIGHAALWGQWRDWLAEHTAAMGVDAEAIKRLAHYVTDDNLTSGWSQPRPGKIATGAPPRRIIEASALFDDESVVPQVRRACRAWRRRFSVSLRSRFPAPSAGWPTIIPGDRGWKTACE